MWAFSQIAWSLSLLVLRVAIAVVSAIPPYVARAGKKLSFPRRRESRGGAPRYTVPSAPRLARHSESRVVGYPASSPAPRFDRLPPAGARSGISLTSPPCARGKTQPWGRHRAAVSARPPYPVFARRFDRLPPAGARSTTARVLASAQYAILLPASSAAPPAHAPRTRAGRRCGRS
ncbi:MAG: hypothetical protein BWY06_00703 [Candidatus Latescibacteria bacterium ADurb.Bin168]|nr:MAG: hypothetical protein BWY06_00703 [Candidatus Latescibacteria bacterium ADurb.Bin168]